MVASPATASAQKTFADQFKMVTLFSLFSQIMSVQKRFFSHQKEKKCDQTMLSLRKV